MKGIIGRTNGGFINKEDAKKAWQKLADDYDLDKIIPKDEQLKPPSQREPTANPESELSVGSKFKNYDVNSDYSYREQDVVVAGSHKMQNIDNDGEEESGLITSDSDFEMAAQTAGYKHEAFGQTATGAKADPQSIQKKNPAALRKDVTRTFKGLLTKNKERSGKRKDGEGSTQYGGSEAGDDFDKRTVVSEIEMKF